MSAGAGASVDISEKLGEIYTIYEFLVPECLSCIAENFGNRPNPNGRVLEYGQNCKWNCAFTSAGVSVVMRLLESNEEKGIDIRGINKRSTEKLPYTIRVGRVEKEVTGETFFRGISNAIGLLWDLHDFSDFADDGGPPAGITPTGINLALNRGLDWFVPTLQEGINVVSFFMTSVPIEKTTTPHHSFVYKAGGMCILADSWVSCYPCDTPGGGTGFDRFERGFTVREIPTVRLEAEIAALKSDATPPAEKVRIMSDTFRGPIKDNYAKYYPSFSCVILKQSVLDEKLHEGFAAEGYMFGGRKKRHRRRTARRKTTKRRRRTMRRRKYRSGSGGV